MLFNSFEFFLFLFIVFCLYWFVFNKSLKGQNLLLLISSYLFYSWWNWRFVGLLLLSTLIDYAFGFWVASGRPARKKWLLALSIFNNLLVLGIFKYYNFFATEAQTLLESIGFHVSPYLMDVVLPVGISFYTFHGMSYVIDIYRGNFKPVKSFTDYALFVSFFPLLVAGPIERATHLLPQIQTKRVFNYTQAIEGCRLILWGLFKKVVVADSLAPIVNEIFNHYHNHSSTTLILGAVYFAFQIYGDFSGYTDIAIGTSKLLGFELLTNFKFPYFSRDIAEFWRRWHISLSSWFRDYLYIPLGGSRLGKLISVRNIFIIFLVSGFWHGASKNFIAWGFIHACGFLPLLLLGKNRVNTSHVVAHDSLLPSVKETLQMLTTFAFVTFSWIFFRSPGISESFGYLKNICTNYIHPAEFLNSYFSQGLLYILPMVILDWRFRRDSRILYLSNSGILRYAFYMILIFFIVGHFFSNTSFIYFQF